MTAQSIILAIQDDRAFSKVMKTISYLLYLECVDVEEGPADKSGRLAIGYWDTRILFRIIIVLE